jgi:hypothetical protein
MYLYVKDMRRIWRARFKVGKVGIKAGLLYTVFSGYNETGYSESLVIPKFSRKNLHFPIQISYYNEISLYNVYRKDFHQIRYKK